MSDDDNTKTNVLKSNTAVTQTKTATKATSNDVSIHQIFKVMVNKGASDLHISEGTSPALRMGGKITKIKLNPLTADDCKRLIYEILSDEHRQELEKNLELDFSFGVKGMARFRANVYYSKGSLSGAFRMIPSLIPDFKALGLPNSLLKLSDTANGLVLVTGPTGSGKSTTLAALIDRINNTRSGHIVTLEDPIEFVHSHKSCIVNQREVGSDTNSFAKGLKSLLRQDPDIVLIGELRDPETIEAALTIAETGHLVFGTLHTNSTVQTINRIINVFPSGQQNQIRTLLSFVLQGVVAQQLLPNIQGGGRSMAMEIMFPNQGIRNLIREDKTHQIYSQLQIGQEKSDMITMNQSLEKLVNSGVVSLDTALSYTTAPEEFRKMMGLGKDDD